MRHTVKLRDVIIGHSDLEESDVSIGRAWGVFRPGFGYELVQPVFQLFSEAVPMPGGEAHDEEKLSRYLAARERLGLSLVDDEGTPISTSAIHIAEYAGRIELDVLISDEAYWASRN